MGKPVKKGSSSTALVTKAGKKSGAYVEPPSPSSERAAAREQGRQQFTAKEFPRPLPAQKGTWEHACDQMCAAFGVKRVRTRQDDNGMRWDTKRQQWVYPPLKEAVKKNAA